MLKKLGDCQNEFKNFKFCRLVYKNGKCYLYQKGSDPLAIFSINNMQIRRDAKGNEIILWEDPNSNVRARVATRFDNLDGAWKLGEYLETYKKSHDFYSAIAFIRRLEINNVVEATAEKESLLKNIKAAISN